MESVIEKKIAIRLNVRTISRNVEEAAPATK